MGLDFSGKVALVTGAGGGIGRSAALAFAQAGAKVVVADMVADIGQETVDLIRARHGDAIFVRTDVTDVDDVKTLVESTCARFGGLDIAFNNAGIAAPGVRTHEIALDAWTRMINVDLNGVWLCMKFEIPAMLARGGGVIVNTASMNGQATPIAGSASYAAAKAGVIALTRTAALEYATENIRVNAVSPGPIRTSRVERDTNIDQITSMVPQGRMGEPEDVAEAVLWLCSDAASFITGIELPIDGGATAGIWKVAVKRS